ncbi:ABC transporter permease [Alkalihalobacillus pseudalcaliphilus]|uniref:ABC transporter permease n=1 Tax=Alkalihalobacillus pseudalcaliphilus TaxID=79884 RepID=UPI0023626E5B|nr:ABC transporter permease [Alkalihalobacillus pseudalcaliphilus]
MTPGRLFLQRVKNEWHYQYKIWKMIVDWVVWFYILLPAAVFGGYQLHALWQGEMEWAFEVPLMFLMLFFIMFSWSGTLRLFILEGDLLFLRKNKEWLKKLMKYGLCYSVWMTIAWTTILGLLIAPLFLVYQQVSLSTYLLLLVFICLLRINIQFVNQWLELKSSRWQKIIMTIILFVLTVLIVTAYVFSPFIMEFIFIFALSVLTVLCLRKRLYMTETFFQDCLRETKRKMQAASFLIGVEGYRVNQRQRKKPMILLRNSAKIFKKRTTKNITAELFIKLFIRNSIKVHGVLRITGVSVLAITLVPADWIKWIAFFVMLFFLNYFIKSCWEELKSHTFFKLYPLSKNDDTIDGIKKGIALLSLPGAMMIGATMGLAALSPVWIVPMALLSGGFTYYMCVKQMLVF